MDEILKYKKQFIYLALQLEKILKVMKHSDPTAKNKKLILYEKYKKNLADLSKILEKEFLWQDVHKMIEKLQKDSVFPVAEDVLQLITDKLLHDFEKEFIKKPELTEFSEP